LGADRACWRARLAANVGRGFAERRLFVKGLSVKQPDQSLPVFVNGFRRGKIDPNTRSKESRQVGIPGFVELANDRNELGLIYLFIDLLRNDLRLGTDASLSSISLLGVFLVADHEHMCDFGISHHSLHKCIFVLTFFEVVKIKNYIHPISDKAFGPLTD